MHAIYLTIRVVILSLMKEKRKEMEQLAQSAKAAATQYYQF